MARKWEKEIQENHRKHLEAEKAIAKEARKDDDARAAAAAAARAARRRNN